MATQHGFLSEGNLALQGYIQVNPEEIEQNLSLFHADSAVEDAFSMLMNSLLAGNILFQSKNGNKTNRYDQDEEASKWRSKVFSEVSRDLVINVKGVGFGFYDAVDDEENRNRFGRKPVILDPRGLDIYFKRDVFLRTQWKVFQRLHTPQTDLDTLFPGFPGGFTNGDMAGKVQTVGGGFLRRELLTARIFCVVPPMDNGDLGTGMKNLWIDKAFEWQLWRDAIIANAQRANPLIISQQVEQKNDDQKLYLGNPADSSMGGMTSIHLGDGMAPGPMKGSQQQSLLASARKVGGPSMKATPAMPDNIVTTKVDGINVRQLLLDPRRQYVKHTLPESPIEHYFSFRSARAEAVFRSFGIPYGMVSQQSSLGTKTSMNENARETYMDTQKRLKQLLVPILRDIYRHVLSDSHAVDYLKDWFKKSEEGKTGESEIAKTLKSKDFTESIDVEVSFPGQPPPEVMERLFFLKIVKWESYRLYLNSLWGIPLDSLADVEPPSLLLESLEEKEEKEIEAKKKKMQ